LFEPIRRRSRGRARLELDEIIEDAYPAISRASSKPKRRVHGETRRASARARRLVGSAVERRFEVERAGVDFS